MTEKFSLDAFRAQKVNTSTVADILDSYGIDGAVDSRIAAVNCSHHHFIGHAYTVEWAAVRKSNDIMDAQLSTWEQVKNFLVPELHGAKDKVYVAGAGPILSHAALAGGMSATYFQQLGFEGVVLGGAIRDIATLRELSLPILASNLVPTDTQGAYRVSATGERCVINNTVIQSGDIIISDETGTVIIPKDLSEEVLSRALQIDSLENGMLDRVRQGERLPELIEKTGRI